VKTRPMILTETSSTAFNKIAMDIVCYGMLQEPLTPTKARHNNILTVQDLTKFLIIYICIYIIVYIYIYMYICIYVYMYMYININVSIILN